MSFPTYQPPSPSQVKRARSMRSAMTEPERKLWRALRQRLPDHHCRRQVSINRYIVDFCCLSARLVIEVDGNQHGYERQQRHDAERTRTLEALNFRVVRFSNADVMRALDSVLYTIDVAIASARIG